MEKDKKEVKILTKIVEGQQVFSTFDVLRILDIKRGRLVQWMKGRYIPEGTRVAWGSGSKTVFGINALYHIALFKLLVDMGLSRELSSEHANHVDWRAIRSYKNYYIIFNRGKEEIEKHHFTKTKQLEYLDEYESALFVNLKKIVENVNLRV